MLHCQANAFHHMPGGVFVYLDIAGEPAHTDAASGGKQQVDGQKPFLQVGMCVMEGRTDRSAEGAVALVAVMAVLAGERTDSL